MTYRRNHLKKKLKLSKKILKNPKFWIFLGLLVIAVAILYSLLFLPQFQVEKINISGNDKIQSKDIEGIVWANINRKILSISSFQILTKSIFAVDSKNLSKDILNKFTNIEEVKVQKNIPKDITLNIKERKSYAVFCQQKNIAVQAGNNTDECFLLDENGVIFEQLENIPQDMIIMRQTLERRAASIGENIIEKNIIEVISKVQKNLKNNFQINIEEVFVSNPLIFKTSENWQIYFDINSDIDLQITKMNALLENGISVNVRKNLQYIYLQYKDRAYYK